MKARKGDAILVKAKVVWVNSEGGLDIELEDSFRVKHIIYDMDPGDCGVLLDKEEE